MPDHKNLRAGWLGDLPQDFAAHFLSLGTWVHVPAGEIVFGIGAMETDLFGIESGAIRMHIAMNEHEQRLAHICGPGFWFGDFEFVAGTPRIMEIDAAVDLRLLRIRRHDFLQLAGSFPDAWRWIAVLVAQHASLSISAADDLMLPSAEKRVAAILLRLTGHRYSHPASPPLKSIPITQQDLAVAANLSRSTAGAVLRDLKRAGEIAIDYGEITVRDADALAARLK